VPVALGLEIGVGAFGEGQRLVRATAIEADYVRVFEPVFSRALEVVRKSIL
jgi:hypothetical protein